MEEVISFTERSRLMDLTNMIENTYAEVVEGTCTGILNYQNRK